MKKKLLTCFDLSWKKNLLCVLSRCIYLFFVSCFFFIFSFFSFCKIKFSSIVCLL